MRWLVLVAVTLVVLARGCNFRDPSSQAEPVQPDAGSGPHTFCGISDFAWTDGGVTARAAQPPAKSLACLRDAGFGAVVSLRDDSPGYDEATRVEALGMTHLLIPLVDDTAPSPAQVTEYLAFVDGQWRAGAPALIHCAGGRGRVGTMEGIYLLWKGWNTREVLNRYIHFGAKIDCDNGGNGQIQALHEIGLLLGRGDAWPEGPDNYGNRWERCPRPDYMGDWDYGTIEFPLGQATPPPMALVEWSTGPYYAQSAEQSYDHPGE